MILVILLLPILFLLAAFAINIAYVELVRTELQITTDAACRAAGREFAISGSEADAIAVAQHVAERNQVAGIVIPLNAADLEFGASTRPDPVGVYQFEVSTRPNAVRITTNSLASGGIINIPPLLPIFGSFFPIKPIRSAVSTQVNLDVSLVIDRSGSMAYSSAEDSGKYPQSPMYAPADWQFGDPVPPHSRWLDTIAAVQVFLNELAQSPQSEQVALSTYNSATATNVKLTEAYSSIPHALGQYSAAFAAGGTNIGGGIYEGLAAVIDPTLSRSDSVKVMILMTDGRHNTGSHPVGAARTAKNNHVSVFTVTFSEEADWDLMRRVASDGGGEHYHATDAVQLKNAFRDIAGRLPTLLTK